jgi:hypothetical protein
MIWNQVTVSIKDKSITTSRFSETILGVLNNPIGLDIVEKMIRIWNQVEMSIGNEVISASGLTEAILEVWKMSIGKALVKIA